MAWADGKLPQNVAPPLKSHLLDIQKPICSWRWVTFQDSTLSRLLRQFLHSLKEEWVRLNELKTEKCLMGSSTAEAELANQIPTLLSVGHKRVTPEVVFNAFTSHLKYIYFT